MRLPGDVYAAVDARKVQVFYAGRRECAIWNENRGSNDLRYYAGWYWAIEKDGRVEKSTYGFFDNGPYHSKSAAYKDAFVELSLLRSSGETKTTQITGSNVVKLATPSSEDRALARKLRQFGIR
jgi:hypothetical protein